MKYVTRRMIHPEMRNTGSAIRTILPYFKVSTFTKCNRALKFLIGKGGKGMKFEEVFISTAAGKSLRLCVYRPLEQKEKHPGVLWIHGGGYAIGIPEQDEGFIKGFVNKFGCTVVAPDYTRSTDAPYPAALEDCYEALLWMKEHADELLVRSDQLTVGGDSAGGGLTAALTIYARDKGEVAISYQMPLYPMLDDRMITPSSQNNDAPVWNTKSNENGWKLYLREMYGKDHVPAYAAPARLTDYSNLPPAFTFVGSVEPFRDETVAYMKQLKNAGIPVRYKVFRGCFHAFDLMAPNSKPAKEARELLWDSFRYAESHFFAEQPYKSR